MLRHTWKGDKREPSVVTWRIEPTESGSRLTYDHTGFTGIDGFIMSKLVLGPIRRRMLQRGLPPVLDAIDDSGRLRPGPRSRPGLSRGEPRLGKAVQPGTDQARGRIHISGDRLVAPPPASWCHQGIS